MAKLDQCRLDDMFAALDRVAKNKEEFAALVISYLNTGRVRPCGNFTKVKVSLPPSLPTLIGNL
jgi:hypothetical protein